MTAFRNLLLKQDAKILGITGGTGRDYLVKQFAFDIEKMNKNLLICHPDFEMMPATGKIVHHQDSEQLQEQIGNAFTESQVVYAGSQLTDDFVKGLSEKTLQKIAELDHFDYMLIVLGADDEYNFISGKATDRIANMAFLDQLIYCYQIDLLDQPLGNNAAQNRKEFLQWFPDLKDQNVINFDILNDYVTDPDRGAVKLFKQSWPAALVLTDAANILLENHAISFARTLFEKNIHHIYFANLKENFIKKIN